MPLLREIRAGRRVHERAGCSRWLLPWCVSLTATTLTGCEGAMWGNLVVLALSVGIFMGTLSLGRIR